MEKHKAVIYIRVSDPSQIENNSLETQLKSCQHFAETNNFDVVKIFQEEGVSAKHVQNRPEMRKLLEYCTLKRNQISAVIVYKMDRWTRNVEEGLIAISLLAKYGVQVLPATEITDQNPMGKAMRTILMALGELDNNLKGERVKDNMRTMFRNGLWCWGVRPGYKRPFKTKEENKGKPAVIDKPYAKIIRSVFIKASEIAVSKKYLADYANSLGIKQFYGKYADGRFITRLIKDSFYYGYMYAPKWKEYAWGKHEPLIDQITWEKANMNVFGNKRKLNMQDNEIFPLKGAIRCGACGHTMTSSNPMGTSKHYLYYECHGKGCKHHERIRVDTAYNDFVDIIKLIKPSRRVLKLFTYMVFSEWDEVIAQTKREADIREAQIKTLEEQITGIAVSNTKRILTDEEARESVEKIRREIAVLKVERSENRIEQHDTESVKNFTETFLIHLDKLWVQMDLPQKQALQNELFPKGLLVDNGKIRIAGLASSFDLIEEMKNENFNFVTPSVEVRNSIMPELIKFYKMFSPYTSRMSLQTH